MHPEALDGAGVLGGLRRGEEDALHHTGKVSQVEEVVGLHGRGQQVLHGFLVHVERALDDLLNAWFEFIEGLHENANRCRYMSILEKKF